LYCNWHCYQFWMYICPSVHLIYNIEYSDYTITSTTSKLVTTVAEINSETSSWKSSDLGAWFEHVVCVEHLYFICARTSWDNEITCILLELGGIYKTRLIRWKAFVPINILNMLTATEVPKLELFAILIGASQNKTIMKIDWITANIRSIYRSTRTWLSDIPHFHILIPTSWDNKIWIVCVKLDTENSITMSWLTWTSTFKVYNLLPCLFIINSDSPRLATCTKLCTIGVIITCKKLISYSWMNCVQKLAWGSMPVLKGSVSIHRDDNILGNSHAFSWSPSDLSCRHSLLHICI